MKVDVSEAIRRRRRESLSSRASTFSELTRRKDWTSYWGSVNGSHGLGVARGTEVGAGVGVGVEVGLGVGL